MCVTCGAAAPPQLLFGAGGRGPLWLHASATEPIPQLLRPPDKHPLVLGDCRLLLPGGCPLRRSLLLCVYLEAPLVNCANWDLRHTLIAYRR